MKTVINKGQRIFKIQKDNVLYDLKPNQTMNLSDEECDRLRFFKEIVVLNEATPATKQEKKDVIAILKENNLLNKEELKEIKEEEKEINKNNKKKK